MKPPPFCEKMQLVHLNDPKSFAGMHRFHVVILPQRGRRLLIPQENQNLAAFGAFDVHVGRLRKALNVEGTVNPIRTVRSAGYSLDLGG